MEKCKICGSESKYFDSAYVLNKYNVSYYICSNCGFIQTEAPYWLNEAYSDAISDSDIGILLRNVVLVDKSKAILSYCLSNHKNILDYGGGYGIYTRMMRDNGFNVEWYDKYAENIFAKGFEKSVEHYDIVTAFELFEHFDDPVKEISDIFRYGDTLLFSTEIIPNVPPSDKIIDWWYFAPQTGQHIAFYTEKSFNIIAAKFNKRYYKISNGFHIITNKKLSVYKLKLMYKLSKILNLFNKRESLLQSDYNMMIKR